MRILLATMLSFSLLLSGTITIKPYTDSSKYERLTQKIVVGKMNYLQHYFDTTDVDIDILLFNKHRDFSAVTGLPKRIPGALISNTNKIYLKTPDLTAMTAPEYEKLIAHELIHALQNHSVSLNLFPDWFNEGLAEYFSESFGLRKKILLSKYLLRDNIHDLNALRFIVHRKYISATQEYVESASVIEFLIATYGKNVIAKLLKTMEKEKQFNTALIKTLNLSEDQLNHYWQSYLKNHYGKLYLIDLQYIIWLFLPFIFIFSIIMKQILNKTIINRWKYEKLEEDINQIFTAPFDHNNGSKRTSSVSIK